MADLRDVDFGSNSIDIYTPQGSPNPWRKSTKAGEHEAAGNSIKSAPETKEEEDVG